MQVHRTVTRNSSSPQWQRAAAAAPELQRLNPRVKVNVDTSDIRTKPLEFYAAFDVTIATDLPFTTLTTINASTRLSGRPFYAAGSCGLFSYAFADLISHEFVIEREKSNKVTVLGAESTTKSIIGVSTKKEAGKTIELVTMRELYSPLLLANTSPLSPRYVSDRRKRLGVSGLIACFRALWEFQSARAVCDVADDPTPSLYPDLESQTEVESFFQSARDKHAELRLLPETLNKEFIMSFLTQCGTELSPVAAFVGGAVAQDVINVLARREQPLQNFLFFDGNETKGPIYSLHPVFPPEPKA
jgi:ubiquitin-like 1-activating enzyme E1 A